MSFSPKTRLEGAFAKTAVDRPPVVCMGGMMNAAVTEIVAPSESPLPRAHFDASLMAKLAAEVRERTGFENYGVPFCMTIEAEALGSPIDPGSLECEPKVTKEAFASVLDVKFKELGEACENSRVKVLVEAVRLLASRKDYPVVASLTGPISAAASIVDPMTFLKELRKRPEEAHNVMRYVTDFLKEFSRRLIEAGADVIAFGDPTATGEILGPKAFNDYAVHYLNELEEFIHSQGGRSIVHICGDMSSSKSSLGNINADAISVDAKVNLKRLKEEFPGMVVMGNLSTYLLEWGPAERIAETTRKLAEDGIDIVSPACGLSCSTRIANIRAMTDAVKERIANAAR